MPILAAPGNHDYWSYDDGGEAAMKKFLSYFEFEPNGSAAASDQQERFHRVDYGPATFIFMDPNNGDDDASDLTHDTNCYFAREESGYRRWYGTGKGIGCRAPDFNSNSVQFAWIEQQLIDAQKKSAFIFVVNHVCPYSVGDHGRENSPDGELLSGRPLRIYEEMFHRYGVTAWLCGHDEMMERSEVYGTEVTTNGVSRPHTLHIWDMGIAGDGLRGTKLVENPQEKFRAGKDATPVLDENGTLTDGGVHYGHLEVTITNRADGAWVATFDPVYAFFTTNAQGQAVFGGTRHYADLVTVVNTDTVVKAAEPVSRTWTGAAGDENWSTPGNWEPAGAPAAGDTITIGKGNSVVCTNATPELEALTVSGTLAFRNWMTRVSAQTVTISSTGLVKPASAFTNSQMSNRVWIACRDLTLASGGKINANELGYTWGNGPAWAGTSTTFGWDTAAPHGGVSSSWEGKTYGSITAPTDPGSGGGNGNFHPSGGGAVRLEATRAVINGEVSAIGGTSYHGWGGGSGSGGSVYISCSTISGTGSVVVDGGGNTSTSARSAGGGGRLAVVYDTTAQKGVDCRVALSARGGVTFSGSNSRCDKVGGSGTIYLSDGRLLKRSGRMLAGYVYYGSDLTRDNELVGENIALTNSLVEIGAGGKVCVTGALSFVCSSTRSSGLRVTGGDVPVEISGDLSLAGARIYVSPATTVSIGGDVMMVGNSSVHKSGEIYVKASPTNGIDQAYGATLAIGGKWTMGRNAGYFPVCDGENGSIVAATAGSLAMDSTALMDANGTGWARNRGPGNPKEILLGAAHGGLGGGGGGKVYGDERRPVEPGSGSVYSGDSGYGVQGGGVVYVATRGRMTLGGTISANGVQCVGANYGAGASAGGSVFLACGGRLSGKATLSANGGDGYAGNGKGGGGGRIAVWHFGSRAGATLATSVAGGKYKSETTRTANWGEDGTVYWRRLNGLSVVLR